MAKTRKDSDDDRYLGGKGTGTDFHRDGGRSRAINITKKGKKRWLCVLARFMTELEEKIGRKINKPDSEITEKLLQKYGIPYFIVEQTGGMLVCVPPNMGHRVDNLVSQNRHYQTIVDIYRP
jgi:hypothetical protein